MHIDFYYWGNICPLSSEIIILLNKYKNDFEIDFYDISDNTKLAREQNIYFPFLTVVDKKHRFYSPISEKFIQQLLVGDLPQEKPYMIELGTRIKSKEIIELKQDNYHLASKCTGRSECLGCSAKIEMYNRIGIDVFGFINVDNDILLGGAEYLPSLSVPYDIPKSEQFAFITCVYLSDKEFDYKSAALSALENHLRNSYQKVFVISDKVGLFPNGDLAFFIRNGYTVEKLIFKDDYCQLHLLSKSLNKPLGVRLF